jgi:hypothetical protein
MGVKKASGVRRKPLKILLFGDSGCGKTHFALQSTPGKTLIFDAESGADLFEGRKGFDFDYWTDDDGLKTASIRELNKAIDFMETPDGRKTYETFIVDPISDIWDNIQAQRLEYKDEKAIERAKKYNKQLDLDDKNETDLESFNQKDWGDMKRIYKNMMLRLKNLPQNVILIAREKEISETKPDGSIVRTGEYTYEAEKNTKYAVDFNVRLVYDEKTKKRYAIVHKTRSDEFEKGQRFDTPTFTMFDNIVNKMKDGVQVDRLSERNENVFTDEDALKNTISEIGSLASVLAETNRDEVIAAIKKHHSSANYNSIKEINVAKSVLEELKKIGGNN